MRDVCLKFSFNTGLLGNRLNLAQECLIKTSELNSEPEWAVRVDRMDPIPGCTRLIPFKFRLNQRHYWFIG